MSPSPAPLEEPLCVAFDPDRRGPAWFFTSDLTLAHDFAGWPWPVVCDFISRLREGEADGLVSPDGRAWAFANLRR